MRRLGLQGLDGLADCGWSREKSMVGVECGDEPVAEGSGFQRDELWRGEGGWNFEEDFAGVGAEEGLGWLGHRFSPQI